MKNATNAALSANISKLLLDSKPRTQKARGLRALGRWSKYRLGTIIVQEEADILGKFLMAKAAWGANGDIFCRACPKLPRPGFVESIRVKTVDDVKECWKLAREADPESELLLMPFVDAQLSAVWSEGLMAIGPGHDGATGGEDCTVVPVGVLSQGMRAQLRSLYEDCGIFEHPNEEHRHAHVEAVYNLGAMSKDELMKIVQVRAGPAAAPGDFFPNDITVTRVFRAPLAHENGRQILLEFDAEIKELAKDPGVLVWQPGGSRGSHVGLQCAAHQVACTFQKEEPQVGEFHEAVKTDAPPNLKEVMFGLSAGIIYPVQTYADALSATLIAMHGYHPRGGAWLGFAAAMMMRLGAAAFLGEARHKPKKWIENFCDCMDCGGKGKFKNLFSDPPGQEAKCPTCAGTGKAPGSRAQIHAAAMRDFWAARSRFTEAAHLFKHGGWAGGYGGPKWLACTMAIIELDEACRAMCKASARGGDAKELTGAVLSKLNNAVNLAHNNGWWMNKFAPKTVFDAAFSGDFTFALLNAPFFRNFDKWALPEKPEILATAAQLMTAKRLTAATKTWQNKNGVDLVKLYAQATSSSMTDKSNLVTSTGKSGIAAAGLGAPTNPMSNKSLVPTEQKAGMYHPYNFLYQATLQAAHCKWDGNHMHIQFKTDKTLHDMYSVADIEMSYSTYMKIVESAAEENSWADGGTSTTQYKVLQVVDDGPQSTKIKLGDHVLDLKTPYPTMTHFLFDAAKEAPGGGKKCGESACPVCVDLPPADVTNSVFAAKNQIAQHFAKVNPLPAKSSYNSFVMKMNEQAKAEKAGKTCKANGCWICHPNSPKCKDFKGCDACNDVKKIHDAWSKEKADAEAAEAEAWAEEQVQKLTEMSGGPTPGFNCGNGSCGWCYQGSQGACWDASDCPTCESIKKTHNKKLSEYLAKAESKKLDNFATDEEPEEDDDDGSDSSGEPQEEEDDPSVDIPF